MPRIPSALRLREFRLFWLAILAMRFANQMVAVAVGWQVYSLHHHPLDLRPDRPGGVPAAAAPRAARRSARGSFLAAPHLRGVGAARAPRRRASARGHRSGRSLPVAVPRARAPHRRVRCYRLTGVTCHAPDARADGVRPQGDGVAVDGVPDGGRDRPGAVTWANPPRPSWSRSTARTRRGDGSAGARGLRRPSTCCPGAGKEALGRLLPLLTDDARRLTQGRPALADTEPELATDPARLTVTFGFGPGLFAAAKVDSTVRRAAARVRDGQAGRRDGAAGTCWCRSAPTTRSPWRTRCG